ncbi:MAG: c-type cytochrome biogenesis protein CcmI [Burkholderiales bacterium]|nr:c-type cytochrome biogenesis protein CcmI [Burkholderiales bacterium]
MTLFFALATLLLVGALAFVLPPLLRARESQPAAREAANAEVYRAELAELAAERARGALGEEDYRRARQALEARVLAESVQAKDVSVRGGRRPAAAVAIALLVPLAAAGGYLVFGTPIALDPQVRKARMPPPGHMEALVEQLWERMHRAPDDPEGWALLGRSLAALGDNERAVRAFAEGARRAPQDAALLADYAEALAVSRGRELAGEPLALVRRALEVDPEHPKALALAGAGEYQSGNYAGAVRHWERLLARLPADSDLARELRESLDEARRLAATPGERGASSAAPVALTGVVSLDPKLAASVSPTDTVYVIARPAEGGRMPLAVARTTVAALPYRFRLDDSMAMAPGATLSTQQKVVVVARVSRSGGPARQKGDIEGVSAPVAPGASDVRVVMSQVIE